MINKNHNYQKKVNMFPMHMLGLLLIVSILSITVGFSALTTSLTINGSASFVPVGMIRVMSMSQDSLVASTEVSMSIRSDSIKNTLELNDINGYATYNVVIKNLGQIDYMLSSIDEVVYSNNQTEYILDGFQIGNIIHANEEVTFKVKFKYKDDVSGDLVSRLNSELKFEFEEYIDTTSFSLVYSHDGACTFNGTSNITGYDCLEYQNKNYIDTGIALYSTSNWNKDFEIGFTIDEYTSGNNINQAVFMNAKYENESLKYPGLVVRRLNSGNDIEVTQTINKGTKVTKTITGYSMPAAIKIFRINGIIYYNVNGGELIELQNMSNFNQQFDVTTWFGAAPDVNGVPMRPLNATLSNMYIKLGKYTPRQYVVTFDANGGSVSEQSRRVDEYNKLGTLPTPTIDNGTTFLGWYSDSSFTNLVDENSVINGHVTLHAKWSTPGAIAMNGVYYSSIVEALNDAPSNTETVISITENLTGKITIPADKNIVFDFGNYTLSNSEASFTIENNGILKVLSGKFTCNSTAAVINNNSTGTLIIEGGQIIATGTKQAVYNDGGTVTITDGAYLQSSSNIRATVHNLNNGTMTITGGTIISTNQNAIVNDKGTMTIGVNDDSISTSSPVIQGKTYGISSSVNYSLYDGDIKGISNAVNNTNKITNIPDNSTFVTSTEVIDGKTYKTLHLESTN